MRKEEKMNLFQKYATISMFMLLIFAPSVIWIFCGSTIGDDNSENRTLTTAPVFGAKDMENYPRKFDNYYNDHAPFRGMIRSSWIWLNYNLLRDSTTQSVIIGKSDSTSDETWLFYSNDFDGNPVKGVQSFSSYPDEAINEAIAILKKNVNSFKGKNIDFYFYIAPNKENVYREYLPDSVEVFKEKSANEEFIEKLKGVRGINVVYPKDEIMGAKNVGQLYRKQDTHWNDLGAFYGYKALMESMDIDFNDYEYVFDFNEKKTNDGDLARFLGLKNFFVDAQPKVEYLSRDSVNMQKIGANNKEIIISENDDAAIDKTIMFVGDSYRNAMVPYLQEAFKKVISMHREAYEEELLEQYSPDIVVSEVVERAMMPIAKFKF